MIAKKESIVILSIPDSFGKHLSLVEGKYGLGKTLVWASDIGPHWITMDFVEWEGFKQLCENIFIWLKSDWRLYLFHKNDFLLSSHYL